MSEDERLDAILTTLQQTLERFSGKPVEVDPRRHFYDMFDREANEYDSDFLKKHHDDLNTTLIFAGLFSAVAAAFIVDIQQELRPNYQALSFATLTMLLNTTSGIPNQSDPPAPQPPKDSVIRVQTMLFCALTTALFAAFLATLGIQWLNFYVEGSLIDRSRHRELRMRGMITWRFKLFLEIVPLFIQLSLFLLGAALTLYMRDISRLVSNGIGIITISCVGLYAIIVIAGTIWKTCPFQTPPSRLIRWLFSVAKEHPLPGPREVRDRLFRLVLFRKQSQPTQTAAYELTAYGRPDGEIPAPRHTGVIPLEEDEGTHVSDTYCISTMFQFASGSDAIEAVVGFILEVNWTSDVGKAPILDVCKSLRRSFELLKDGRAIVRSGMRGQACGSAKALLYLWVQRLCIGSIGDGRTVSASLEPLLQSYRSKEDHELASTLQVLGAVINGSSDISWEEFVFNDAHYCWLSHIIRLRAWLTLRAQRSLTKDVSGFIVHSFSKDALSPRVMADCLLIINMFVGGRPDLDDKMLIKDKSGEIEDIIRRIYRSIESALGQYSLNAEEERAIEALKLLEPLKHKVLCAESYELFRKIVVDAQANNTVATVAQADNMTTAAAQTDTTVMVAARVDGGLWRPVELLVSGAFKRNMEPPCIGNPELLIDFLNHCLKGEGDQDGPMERVMLALGGAATDELRNWLAKLEVTGKPFLSGICRALRKDAPYPLRRSTIAFLRHLDEPLFRKTPEDFFVEYAGDLVSGWSSSAEESMARDPTSLALAEALVTTFMGLLDSPFWREYIPGARWEILRFINNLGDKLPRSLHRCFQNREIIEYLHDQKCPNFTNWLAIMWNKYPHLSEAVKMQLKDTTKAMKDREIAAYLFGLEGEIERYRKRVTVGRSRCSEEEFVELKTRLKSLRSARKCLEKMKKPPSSS